GIPPLACFKIDMIWLSLCFDIVIYSISSFVARKFYSFWQLFLGKITLLSHKDINIHKKNSHNDTPLDLATNKPEIFKLLNDYKESHEISMVSQDQEQEVQTLGEEYNYDAFDGASLLYLL
ncbi:MAG: hypothetical protein ACRCRR_01425, partial [Rickettsia sp.]